MIRNSSKALIVRDGKILLSRCRTRKGVTYYDLPGGGQRTYETMEEAVRREVLEETGLIVWAQRLVGITESIYDDPAARAAHGEYCHRICHIFTVRIEGEDGQVTAEMDYQQLGSEWRMLEEAERLPVCPPQARGRLRELMDAPCALFWGSRHVPAMEEW